jgi:hypothetical protein
MKLLFVFILLPTLLISLYTGTQQPLSGPDTVKVTTAGANNLVVIDSLRLHETAIDTFLVNSLQGEIIQSGQNNSVEINSGGEIPNDKLKRSVYPDGRNPAPAGEQITNKHQKTNNKNQTDETCNQKPGTCNVEPATIKIKQTGKNNSVKINQR